jgi:regulator of replication initiation timing
MVKGSGSVSVRVDDKRPAYSVEAALIALAQARDQIGIEDDRLRRDSSVGSHLKGDDGSKTSAALELSQSALTNPPEPADWPSRRGLSMWGLLGLGACVPIGIVVLGWHFLYRQVDVAPASTSSVSRDVSANSATPSPTSSRVAPQKDKTVAFVGSPRLDESVAAMAREVADLKQEIEQLKTRQSQIPLDNSELDRQLKQAQELPRSNADLIKDLKTAQTQLAQDNAELAAQLKASQEQVSKLTAQLDAGQTQVATIAAQIKAMQNQNARVAEQKQRSKLPISPAAASSPPKQLPPKPRLQPAKPQAQNPPDTQ